MLYLIVIPLWLFRCAVISAIYALVILFHQDSAAVGFVFYTIAVFDRGVFGNLA